jgi:hypothetical protein
MLVLAGVLPRAFTEDASVLDQTALLWPLFALMQPLNGAVFALDGILIGASDGRFLAVSMVGAFSRARPCCSPRSEAIGDPRRVGGARRPHPRALTLMDRFRGRWLVTAGLGMEMRCGREAAA